MKKLMKVLALCASAVIGCGAIPAASAEALYWWGIAGSDQFQEMTPLDDKEMLQWVGYGGIPGTPCEYQVLTYHNVRDVEHTIVDENGNFVGTEIQHIDNYPLYVVMPRENELRIVLRSELDPFEAAQQMKEIIHRYYDDSVKIYTLGFGTGDLDHTYHLRAANDAQISEEIAASIMKDLAEAGLLAEFYTWGQTADYQQVCYKNPTAYPMVDQKWNSSFTELEDVQFDWDAIGAYVDQNYPECEFLRVTQEDIELAKKIGYYDYAQDKVYFANDIVMYAVIPPEGTAFPEHFAIAADLYAQFGLSAEWLCPASFSAPMTGQNALAIPGNVNLDITADVSDAVLLARFCAEDNAAVITEHGKKNADVDGNGKIETDDMTALLRSIAKLD